MVLLYKRIKNRLVVLWKSNRYYLWYGLRKEREKLRWAELAQYYELLDFSTEDKKVICIYEGKVVSGGLADRFRGILSVFYVCKKLGIDFSLKYTHPFNLEDYLLPNKYNWHIDENEVVYKLPKENVLILDSTQDSEFQKHCQESWLINRLKQCKGQIHVYTNASFSYEKGYHELFNELFKPSARLASSIEKQKEAIGGNYVSISCRFLDLLGDFNETFGYNVQLTADEKETLLNRLKQQVEKIHNQNPNSRVLVNSDSTTFLSFIRQQLPYTYIIPGYITHIDNKTADGGYEYYEKTFVDFFMIAQAEHIYVLKTGRMHISGYPYAASFVYNRPFDLIRF